MKNRRVVDFAVNKVAGGASVLPHEGFERPPLTASSAPTERSTSSTGVRWCPRLSAAASRSASARASCGASAGHRIPWRRSAKPVVPPVNLLRLMLPFVATAVALGLGVRAVIRWLSQATARRRY
jgi:hypothetical protein